MGAVPRPVTCIQSTHSHESQARSERDSHLHAGTGDRAAVEYTPTPKDHSDVLVMLTLHANGWEAVDCISQALSIVKVVLTEGDGVPNPHLVAGGRLSTK